MRLLLAETFEASTDAAKSVHEVHFKRPVRLSAFRVVAQGDVPHPELSFHGKTPATPFVLELFGAQVGKGSLCTALWKGKPPTSSALELLSSEGLCDYMVVRCAALLLASCAPSVDVDSHVVCDPLRRVDSHPLSLCLYGTESDAAAPPVPAWESLTGFWRAACAYEWASARAAHMPGLRNTGPDQHSDPSDAPIAYPLPAGRCTTRWPQAPITWFCRRRMR